MSTTARVDAGIDEGTAQVYEIPTDAPEADGTLAWSSTTLVLAEVHAGGRSGNTFRSLAHLRAANGRFDVPHLAPGGPCTKAPGQCQHGRSDIRRNRRRSHRRACSGDARSAADRIATPAPDSREAFSSIRMPTIPLAGAAGFEPANAGTKNRCLTTWRRPSDLHYEVRESGGL